jgi:ADP-ribose diphosphatase
MSAKQPIILRHTAIAKTRLFRIEEVDLEFSNGEQRTYERLANNSAGAVLIIAMPDPQTLLMVREYAVGVERYELTFPKGKIDPGEDILTAAERELMEETGFAAAKLSHLHSLSLAAGYSTHFTHIILAEGLSPALAEGDEPEPLEIIHWPVHNMHQLLTHPECSESRTIAALYICQQHLAEAARNDA